ncbi:MAG: HAD family hydrolase [Desulfobulbaceae bacterium]|nr:HAD family hydrolase [Desulfobulbaceae bacterium]
MPSDMPLRPTALLFDMDGVLVNTFLAWYGSFVDLFADVYGQQLSREVFLQRFWGRDLRDIFNELDLEMAVPFFCRRYFSVHTDKVEIFPDTIDTLAALAAFRKAVITNTPAACAELILQDLGIREYFTHIITGDDVTVGKPDPAIVLKGCELLGCTPDQAVVIGDHQVDIDAARNAGCRVIGVGIDGDFKVESLSGLRKLFVDLIDS